MAEMATPKKALIDFLYLSPAKSNLFRALPELELPRGFSAQKANKIINQIRSVRRNTHFLSWRRMAYSLVPIEIM